MAGSVGNTEAGFKFAAYHQKFTVSLKYLEEKEATFIYRYFSMIIHLIGFAKLLFQKFFI